MRMSRLAEWVAGGLAGCPGIVRTAAPEGSPVQTSAPQDGKADIASPSGTPGRRRGPWVTTAALVLVAEGLLVIPYLPALTASSMGPLPPLAILIGGLAVLHVAAGIGLLRLYGWARLAASILSACGLLFVHTPALMAAMSNGAWSGIDWLGIVGTFVVLFAVLRRWPAAPAAATSR